MKLSKLIRELSIARDNLKIDPEVEIYTRILSESDMASATRLCPSLEYKGKVKSMQYRHFPDRVRLICD